MQVIKLATRDSSLAIKQALLVKESIKKNFSDIEIELLKIKTKGDKITNQSLNDVGGKGLFVKELQEALLAKQADLAVHSMKDVPALTHDKLCLRPVLKREDPRDVLVSLRYNCLSAMPANSIIGTTSPRRKGQILALKNDLQIKDCRGNVVTRLKKLINGEYAAIILAAAGLNRINQRSHIKYHFNDEEMLPAPTQGILGVEFRKEDLKMLKIINQIIDKETSLVCLAERSFLKHINADCQTPIAAFAQKKGDELIIKAGFYLLDGSVQFLTAHSGNSNKAEVLGRLAAENIMKLASTHIRNHINLR